MVQRTGVLWALLLALIATAGCSSSKPKAANTVPTTAASTTTTADPYAVPATIDVAYVQRVMDAIDPLIGRAAKALVRDKSIDGEWAAVSRAILDESGLAAAKYGAQLELGVKLRDYKTSPGQTHTTVKRVLTSRSDCLVVRAVRDSSEIVTLAGAVADKDVELRLGQAAWDPNGLNPTPWVISNVSDPGAEVEPCAA